MKDTYIDVVALLERTHRRFLEVVKLELDNLGIPDINNMQAMILFNIGDLEMTVGELTTRGCYLGANVSYNVKKMLEAGYIVQQRSLHDRRAVKVRLTEKGLALRAKLASMHDRHVVSLAQGLEQADDLVAAHKTLRKLERFWTQILAFGTRPAQVTPAA
jgi:DNA-binding MarR family transcriptional regulator